MTITTILANHSAGFVHAAPYVALAIIAWGIWVCIRGVSEARREFLVARASGLIPRQLYARAALRVQVSRTTKLVALAAVAISVAIDWPPAEVRTVVNTALLLLVILLIVVDSTLDRRMNREVVTYLVRNRYRSFEGEDER